MEPPWRILTILHPPGTSLVHSWGLLAQRMVISDFLFLFWKLSDLLSSEHWPGLGAGAGVNMVISFLHFYQVLNSLGIWHDLLTFITRTYSTEKAKLFWEATEVWWSDLLSCRRFLVLIRKSHFKSNSTNSTPALRK